MGYFTTNENERHLFDNTLNLKWRILISISFFTFVTTESMFQLFIKKFSSYFIRDWRYEENKDIDNKFKEKHCLPLISR